MSIALPTPTSTSRSSRSKPKQLESQPEIESIPRKEKPMDWLINTLSKARLLKGELDYHLVRISMVVIYFFFGYQKWFNYEAQGLIPFFTHGPLIFWMYGVFGVK